MEEAEGVVSFYKSSAILNIALLRKKSHNHNIIAKVILYDFEELKVFL